MTKREALVESLKINVMRVVFTKKDGEERIMTCTLSDYIAPEIPWRGDIIASKKKVNEEVLAVWDIDKDAWRSFRLDSITDLKVIEKAKELI